MNLRVAEILKFLSSSGSECFSFTLQQAEIMGTRYPVKDFNTLDSSQVSQESSCDRLLKSAKTDDTRVPTELWDHRLASRLAHDCNDMGNVSRVAAAGLLRSMDLLRIWGTCVWRKRVTQSFLKWYSNLNIHGKRARVKTTGLVVWDTSSRCY